MKATIEPLQGKYYETIVRFGDVFISLGGGSGRASDREICNAGFNLSQYMNDEVDPDSDMECTVREIVDDCGGHYEKQSVYETAMKIVEALNGEG